MAVEIDSKWREMAHILPYTNVLPSLCICTNGAVCLKGMNRVIALIEADTRFNLFHMTLSKDYWKAVKNYMTLCT